jgi:hypothetical protein
MRTSLCAVATLAAAAILAVPAGAATTLYVSPNARNPNNNVCSAGNPCSLRHGAETVAVSGDDVLVAAGDYVLSATLAPTPGITLEGRLQAARPRLLGSAPALGATVSLGAGSTLRHLDIEQSGNNTFGVIATTTDLLDDLAVVSTATSQGGGVELQNASAIRDSTVRASGTFGEAIISDKGTNDVRNVTATSPPESTEAAITVLTCCGYGATTLNVVNTIARGNTIDIEAATGGGGTATATLHVRNSNYRPQSNTDGAPSSLFFDDGGNQTSSDPVLANLAGGDFHELQGSPTIDAGLDQPLNGFADIDGQPRVLGSAPDIGADEFGPAPAATTGGVSDLTTTSATVAGTVNPNDLPTTWHFDYGPTAAYGLQTPDASLPAGLATQAVSGALAGLDPAKTYHYRLVAVNGSGTTAGDDGTLTTATAPPGPVPPALVPPAAPVLSGAAIQRFLKQHAVVFTVTDADASALVAGGVVRVSKAKTVFALRAVTTSVAARGTTTFTLTAPSATLKAVRRALKQKRKVTARITVTAYNAAGASAPAALAVTLKK